MKKIMCLLTMLMLLSVGVFAANENTVATNAVDHKPVIAQQQDKDMEQIMAKGDQPEANEKQKNKFFSWGTNEVSQQRNKAVEAVEQAWEKMRNRFREWFKIGQEKQTEELVATS